MNSGATIFDDREAVELLREHPHLLAIADAVRATQSEATRSLLRRKPLLLAAVAACAVVAALIAFLAVSGASSHHTAAGGGSPQHPITVDGGAPGSGSAVQVPGGPVPLSKAQSDALNSFGVPLILPDTSVLKPSGAETAFEQWCPSTTPGAPAPLCQVNIQFPLQNVGIEYAPTAQTYWGSAYPDALDQYKAEIAQSSNLADQIVYLSGTPALLEPGKTGTSIEFRLGKLSISIWSPNAVGEGGVQIQALDGATVQALAQSIVDQAGSK